ncbi:MAG: histidinol-phosphate transaminase [Balneolaceae bacterium]|nr:histidinol-phosphate transaminase [Balneolaceae bacterium]MBO6547008.1 histidinol-phosphate transaminase [Balneolaceae bacterium]MBO6649368.1 histidinol-phosphate transaminase [Balneolaceae bacterium]
MSSSPQKEIVPANIEQLKPYVAGKTIAEVVEAYQPNEISKLASNENRLGHSASVDEAVNKALKVIHDYPDPLSKQLRSAIAERIGVKQENLIVGSGSESLLGILCKTFFHNKQNIITADVTFIGMYVQAQIRGVKIKKIPLTKDFRFDVKAMVNAIDEHTRMLYIANPNNPTGTYIANKEFEWLMENVPKDVLVIMDEAYYEFAHDVEDYPDVLSYNFENVIILRTFSKGYGLAGFRVGYGIAQKNLIDYMLKTKLAFEPGGLGQAAALAAFQDADFLEQSRHTVQIGKEELYNFFDEHNVKYVPSISNFVMMVFETEDEAVFFTQKMLEEGVILRRINAFGLASCVRVTIGIPKEMEHFKRAFKKVFS